jgi:hypothetical protein
MRTKQAWNGSYPVAVDDGDKYSIFTRRPFKFSPRTTHLLTCVTSGFRRDADEICALLEYYATMSGSSVPTIRDFLTPEDGTDRLTRNVGTQLPLSAAQYPRSAKISSWNLTGGASYDVPKHHYKLVTVMFCIEQHSQTLASKQQHTCTRQAPSQVHCSDIHMNKPCTLVHNTFMYSVLIILTITTDF